MEEFRATLILAGLFALRCIAPVIFTLAVGYFMNRLVERWEAQDEAAAAEPTLDPIPGSGALALPTIEIPCWVFKNCEPATRSECPAYLKPKLACWLARTMADGELPAACADCERYAATKDLVPAI